MAGRTIRVDQQRIGHLPGREPCQKNRGKSTSRRSHVGCLALIKSARHQKELSAISIKSNVHFTRNRFAIDTDQSVAGRHVGLGYEVVTLQNLCPNPPRDFVTTKRSEEHTSELQSLMRISYAVFCLKKKNKQ